MNRNCSGMLSILFATLLVGTARDMFEGFGVAVFLPEPDDPHTIGGDSAGSQLREEHA